MATGNSAQFNLQINTKANLEGLNKIKSELQNLTKGISTESFDFSSLEAAKRSAQDLSTALSVAFNPTLNTYSIDKFNASLKQSNTDIITIQNDLARVGIEGQQAFLKATSQCFKMNTTLKQSHVWLDKIKTTITNTFRYQVINMAIQKIGQSISTAAGYVKNLDTSLNNIRIVTEKNASSMAKFAQEANKAAQAMGTGTTDYTDASLIYYQQGLNDAQVKERTDVTMKMANVLGDSAETVSENMTAIWNNFDDGSKSLEYYGDVITELGARTAASADEIATGLGKFSAVADTVGLSYEYATASLATVVAETRQSADTVGTAFKTLFARIQDLELGNTLDDGTTLGQYSEALEKVGVSIKDSNGELKSMDSILDDMGTKWQSLSKDEQVALAQNVAGTRQYTQLVSLMDNWDKVKENIEAASASEGTLESQQEIYMDSVKAHAETMTAAWENFYDSILGEDTLKSLYDVGATLGNGMAIFSDSIGGIIPLLVSLGSTGLKVFSADIGRSLQTTINNFKIMSSATEQETQKVQALKNAFAGKDTWINSFNLSNSPEMTAYFNEMVQMYSELSQYKNVMSQEDINIFNGLVEQKEKIGEIKIEYEKVINELKTLNENKGGVFDALTLSGENFQKTLVNIRTAYANFLTNTQAVFTNTSGGLDQPYTEQYVAEINKYIKAVEAAGGETKNLQDIITKTLNAKGLNANFSNGVLTLGTSVGLTKEQFEALDKVLSQDQKQLLQTASRVSALEGQEKSLSASVNQSKDALTKQLKFTQVASNVTSVVGSLGQLSMGITTATNLIKTWGDDSVSAGEKVLQTFTGLSFMLPNILNSFQGLEKSFGVISSIQKVGNATSDLASLNAKIGTERVNEANSLAKIANLKAEIAALKEKQLLLDADTQSEISNAEANMMDGEANYNGALSKAQESAAIKDEINAKEAEIIATKQSITTTEADRVKTLEDAAAKKAAAETEAKAKLVKLGWAAAVLVAVAAITALIVEQEKLNKAMSNEGQLEAARKVANDLTTAYNETKDAAEELENTISDYQTVIDTLDNCTKGTQEWKDALQEVEDKTTAIIQQYPELLKVANLYNQDGSINIDVLNDKLNNLNSTADIQQTGSLLAAAEVAKRESIAQYEDLYSKFYSESINPIYSTNNFAYGALLSLSDTMTSTDRYNMLTPTQSSEFANYILDNAKEFSELTDTQLSKKIKEYIEEAQFNLTDSEIQLLTTKVKEQRKTITEYANSVEDANVAINNADKAITNNILKDKSDLIKNSVSNNAYSNYQTNYKTFLAESQRNINQLSGNNDPEAAAIAKEYLEKTGQTGQMFFSDVTGDDSNRAFVFTDTEGNETTVSKDQLAREMAAAEAIGKLKEAAEGASKAFEHLAKNSDEKTQNVLESYFANGNFEDLTVDEFNAITSDINDNYGKSINEYLQTQFGKSNEELGEIFGLDYATKFREAQEDYIESVNHVADNLLYTAKSLYEDLDTKGLTLAAKKSLGTALEDAVKQGGPSLAKELSNLFKEIPTDKLEEFLDIYQDIDWNTETVEDFKEKLKEIGISLPDTNNLLDKFISRMKEIANVDFSESAARNKAIHDITNGLEIGDTISTEDYNTLKGYSEDFADFFAVTADGEYKLIGATEDFQDTVDNFINSADNTDLEQLQKSKAAYDKATVGMSDVEKSNYGNIISEDDIIDGVYLNYKTGQVVKNGKESLSREDQTRTRKQLQQLVDEGILTSDDYETYSEGIANHDKDILKEIIKVLNENIPSYTFDEEGYEQQFAQFKEANATSAKSVKDLRNDKNLSDEEKNKYAQSVAYEQVEKLGIDIEELEEYTKAIVKNNKALENNKAELYDLAIAKARDEKGTKDAIEAYDSYSDYIIAAKDDYSAFEEAMKSKEGGNALNDFNKNIKDSFANILNVDTSDLSEDFVQKYWTDIQKYLTDVSSRKKLKAKLKVDITLNSILEDKDAEIQAEVTSLIEKLQAELDNQPIGTTINIENSEALQSLSDLVTQGKITSDEMAEIFESLNVTPNFEPIYKPIDIATINDQGLTTDTETRQIIVGYKVSTRDFAKTGGNGMPTGDATTFATKMASQSFLKSITVKGNEDETISSLEDEDKGSGGGGGGSSSKDKDEDIKDYEDYFEEFHDENQAIKDNDKAIQKLQRDREGLTGSNLAESLRKENELLEKQKQNYEKLVAAQERKRESVKKELETLLDENSEFVDGMKLQFDEETGEVTNYGEITQKAYDIYKALEEQSDGTMDETAKDQLEKAKEFLEKIAQLLGDYESIQDNIDETTDKIEQATYDQISNNLEAWQAEIDVKLNLEKAKEDWIEFVRDMNTDFRLKYKDPKQATYGMVEQAQSIANRVDIEIGAMNDIQGEMEKLANGGESTMFHNLDEATTALQNAMEELEEAEEELKDLAEECWDIYIELIEQIHDQFNDINDKFDMVDTTLTHAAEVAKLLYDDDAYDKIGETYDAQIYNSLTQLDSFRQQAAFWEEQYYIALEENGPDTEDTYLFYQYWQEALANLYAQEEKYIEELQAKAENAIDSIFSNIEKQLTNSWGFDAWQDEWTLATESADKYYDEIERLNKLNSLSLDWQNTLTSTTDLNTQKELAAAYEAQIEALKNKSELTEADMSIAQKEYDLVKAEAELEDAQNNKTTMKLTRGADGNWSYQYVADADEVAEKQQAILDAQEELYTATKEATSDLIEDTVTKLSAYYEKLSELSKSWYKETDADKRAALETQMGNYETAIMELMSSASEEYSYLIDKLSTETASTAYDSYMLGDESFLNEDMLAAVKAMVDEGVTSWTDFYTAAHNSFSSIGTEGKKLATSLSSLFGSNTQMGSFFEILSESYNALTSSGNSRTDNQAAVDTFVNALSSVFLPNSDELNTIASDYFEMVEAGTVAAGEDYTNISQYCANSIANTTALADDTAQLVETATEQLEYVREIFRQVNSIYESSKSKAISAGNSAMSAMGASDVTTTQLDANQAAQSESAATMAKGIVALTNSLGTLNTSISNLSINTTRNSAGSGSNGTLIKSAVGLASGGYTGTWVSSGSNDSENGKLAWLHQKELVLNADDTENLLDAVQIVRDIPNLGTSIASAISEGISSMVSSLNKVSAPSVGETQSNVTNETTNNNTYNVDASFPNAEDVTSIQEALLSLPNIVAQYIHR